MTRQAVEAKAGEKPKWRLLRFAAGYVVGLAIVPGALGLVALYIEVQARPPAPTHRSVFVSDGQNLSGARVASVVWRRKHEVLRQTCRDTCDDVAFSDAPARAGQIEGGAAGFRPSLKRVEEPLQ